VFLLDEPLSNLDAKLRASARGELAQFHERVGTTTIYVTHDQVEAMAMGERIVVLHRGVVRQIGTPREVYDQPADTFVATFLGSPPMNLLDDGSVIVGFRPEALLPAGMVPQPAVPIRLRVTNVEYLGAERILYGAVEGGRFDGKRVLSRIAVSAGAGNVSGATHDFAIRVGDLAFFDRKSERRTAPRQVAWR
jgi:multiple sugar transport system ATP-binding protein